MIVKPFLRRLEHYKNDAHTSPTRYLIPALLVYLPCPQHGNAPTNIGLTPLQLAILQNDTHRFVDKAIATLAENGYFIWQGFNNNPGGDPDSVSPAPDSGSCSGWMEMTCNEAWQSVPMTMAWGATDKVHLFLGVGLANRTL